MSRNFLGGFYQPGKPLPVFVREEIVDLYNNGVGVSEISRNTRVTKGAVHKVVQHFALHGTTQPFSCGGSQPILITDDVLEVIETWKLRKPSLYASEIRERLLTHPRKRGQKKLLYHVLTTAHRSTIRQT